MKRVKIVLVGMACVLWGFPELAEARKCPCGIVAWVESVSASATQVKCGEVKQPPECEIPPCPTRRYRIKTEEDVWNYKNTSGTMSATGSKTETTTRSQPAAAKGSPCPMTITVTGTYAGHFLDGTGSPDCTGTLPIPAGGNYCGAYNAAIGYFNTSAHMSPKTTPACSGKVATEDQDPASGWLGSTRTVTTTYASPVTNGDLKGKVKGAIGTVPAPEDGSSQWQPGASSAYAISIKDDGSVEGSGTKSRYRFRIAGSEAGQNYKIVWEVWESDQDGTRFSKAEKTSFTGNGKPFQIVDGRVLDLPSAGETDCEVGGGTQFVNPDTIEVVITDEDEEDEDEAQTKQERQ